MAQKKKLTATVFRQEQIAAGIYDMWIETDLAKDAKPGQFISIYPKNQATLLPRPISICEVNEEKSALRIVYRVAGQGTREFSNYHTGESIEILGTLGNGFPLEKADGKRVFLMGGGIGIPPMLQLSKELSARGKAENISAILGYRNELFLYEDFKAYADVYAATEDGSSGSKGTVMDAIRDNDLKGDIIFACGPMPMLKGIAAICKEKGIYCEISLEERMACGIGACLGCACRTTRNDEEYFAHVCKDGPVFNAEEVIW